MSAPTVEQAAPGAMPGAAPCDSAEGDPAGWDPALVARWHSSGVPIRALRSLLIRYPAPGAYRAAYRDAARTGGVQLRPDVWPDPDVTPLAVPDGCWILLAGHGRYPAPLAATSPPPLLLYGRGYPAALAPGVAIVGTRQMSAYGQAVAATAVAAAGELGVPTVSGLAVGCDRAAAEASLTAGVRHTAVLATGPDTIGPAGRAELADTIVAAGGAIVSEHPFGTPADTHPGPGSGYRAGPYPSRLMARNRIIAGLATVTVVAEATLVSGTMGTVWAALTAGRPLLVALPKPHARTWPGAQAPLALAAETRRTTAQLRELGMPAGLARDWPAGRPLANGAAEDRDMLAAMIRLSVQLSPHR